MEPAAPKMELHVTQERLERLKVGVWRKAQAGDLNAVFTFLAHFMVDERGRFLKSDAAFDILDEFEMGELQEAVGRIETEMREAAVPKAPGGTST